MEILVEDNGLDEVADPFLAQIHIGESEVNATLIPKVHPYQKELLLSVTVQTSNTPHADTVIILYIYIQLTSQAYG